MRPEKLLLAFLICLIPLSPLACVKSEPAPQTKPPTITPATPKPPILEIGQSAQFPGFIVQLRRAIWQGNKLQTYWLISNNGTTKLDAPFSNPTFAASDKDGNEGSWLWSFEPPPQWDPTEEPIKELSYLSELWPSQTTRAYHAWEFGPLSTGIRITVTYYSGSITTQITTSSAIWLAGK